MLTCTSFRPSPTPEAVPPLDPAAARCSGSRGAPQVPARTRRLRPRAWGSRWWSAGALLAIFTVCCLPRAAAADDVPARRAELRGYGPVSCEPANSPAAGVEERQYRFADAAKAELFLSKLYGDFTLTVGNTIQPVATARGPAEAISLAEQSYLLPLLVRGERRLVVLSGADLPALVARANHWLTGAPLGRHDVSHPRFMDKWDRYSIGIWQSLSANEHVANHPGMAAFTQWLGEIGVTAQMNVGNNAIDLVANDNLTTWYRHYLDLQHVNSQRVEWLPHQLDLYNRNPFLLNTSNPHVATAWSYYAEHTMAHSLLRDAQNATALASLKPTLADPGLVAILDPDGELGPFDYDTWGYSGPTAQREFVRFLREVRHLSLDDVSRRYTGQAGQYAHWSDVPLADWREFYGWTAGAVDLAGEWRFMRDDALAGFREGWAQPGYDDAGWIRLYYPGDALVYTLDGAERPLWMRRTFTVDPAQFPQRVYLSLAPLTRDTVQVFLNGQPLAPLDPQFHTARTFGQLDITDLIPASRQLTLVLRLTHGAPNGPLFLTPQPAASFPTPDPRLNARRWDQIEFTDWAQAQGVAATLQAIRSADPDRPIKVHAYEHSAWGWKTLAEYGAYSHHTGASPGWYYLEPKRYAASRGLPHSSEPGGPMASLSDFMALWGTLAYIGTNAHDYFMSPQDITNDPAKLAYFERQLPAIKVMGRVNALISPVAAMRGLLNTHYAGEFATAEDWRYGVDVARGGELVPLLDEVRLREGHLQGFAAIVDEGTPCWDEELAAALRSYVEEGGVLVLNSLSGRHTFVAAGQGAGPGLGGVTLLPPPAPGRRGITYGQPDARLPGLSGQDRYEDRLGPDEAHTLQPLAGTDVIGTYADGTAAVTRRALGKGVVYYCGGSTIPGGLARAVAAACGPPTFVNPAPGLRLRLARANNGCEDLLLACSTGKKATVSWTLEQPPAAIYNAVTGARVPAQISGNVATFEVDLPANDFAWFAARRPALARPVDHWLARQQQLWSGTAKGQAPRVDLFRHLDLNHGWLLAQTASLEQAQALLALDDHAAGLVPTELMPWDTPGMATLHAADTAGLYRRTFDLPVFWRNGSQFVLALRGQIHDSQLHGFRGASTIFLNGVKVWAGERLDQEWLDVTAALKPTGNRLEIVYRGPGLMPSIMLVRSAVPAATIDLAGPWQVVSGLHDEVTGTLPGTVTGAFLYRDVTLPASAREQEVWLRVAGPCRAVIINGRRRYWDLNGANTFAQSPVYEVNITPDIRPNAPNRIVICSDGMEHGWQTRELVYTQVELALYRPGQWSADGTGIAAALSAAELAGVARDLSVIQPYPLVHPTPAAPDARPSLAPPVPLVLPPVLVDLDLAAADGKVVDRGPHQVPLTVTGTVVPFSEAAGQIKGVYLRGEQDPPGTIALPARNLRPLWPASDFSLRVWVKPLAFNRAGGTLVSWQDYMFGWSLNHDQSAIWLPPPGAAKKLIVGNVITPHQWQCLTLVMAGRQATLYLDGVPIGAQTAAAAIRAYDAPFYIGSTAGARDFINAKLGAFTLYAGALAPGEVAAQYREERAHYVKTSVFPEDYCFDLKIAADGLTDAVECPAKLTVGQGSETRLEDGQPVLALDGKASYLLVSEHARHHLFWAPSTVVLDFQPAVGSGGTIFRRHHTVNLNLTKDGALVFDANIGLHRTVTFPRAITMGAWNRLEFSYDGKIARVVVNGQLVGEQAYAGSLATGSDYPWVFFADNTHPQFPAYANLHGLIRELSVRPWTPVPAGK